MGDPIHALLTRWRKINGLPSQAGWADSAKRCANELEAALAALPPTRLLNQEEQPHDQLPLCLGCGRVKPLRAPWNDCAVCHSPRWWYQDTNTMDVSRPARQTEPAESQELHKETCILRHTVRLLESDPIPRCDCGAVIYESIGDGKLNPRLAGRVPEWEKE